MKAKQTESELRHRIVGSFLKEYREAAELTQSEIAKALSYSSSQFVSNWERGLALPPLSVLPKLAKLLAIPPKHMIETLHRYQEELLKLQKQQLFDLFRQQVRS